jgi:hypothetical protein
MNNNMVLNTINKLLSREESNQVTFANRIRQHDELLSERYMAEEGIMNDSKAEGRDLDPVTDGERELLQSKSEELDDTTVASGIQVDYDSLVRYDEVRNKLSVDTGRMAAGMNEGFEALDSRKDMSSFAYDMFSSVASNIQNVLDDQVSEAYDEVTVDVQAGSASDIRTYDADADTVEIMGQVHESTGNLGANTREEFEAYDIAMATTMYEQEN